MRRRESAQGKAHPPNSPERARPMTRKRTVSYLTSLFSSLAFLALTPPALSDEHGSASAEPRHGIAMHGSPKYTRGFSHFDYVNPEAPKGGTLKMAVVANGFDSFNPFDIRGVAAAGISTYLYDTLLVPSDDEPFSAYGLIAESLETPEDRSYVVFNLREQASFHDGEPITAEGREVFVRDPDHPGSPVLSQLLCGCG